MSKTSTGLTAFVKQCLNDHLGYVYGAFGQVCTTSVLDQYAEMYPDGNLAGGAMRELGEKWLGRRVVDCSGLVKYYLMTEKYGDSPTYQAKYDTCVQYSAATQKGQISSLPELPGVLVYMPGHVGVYIGNGEVIESAGTAYGVVKSKLPVSYTGGRWTHWYQCPYIEYKDTNTEESVKEEIAVGSKVKIAAGAHYTNGVAVPSSVLTGTYTVQQLSTSKKEALLREIFSWISVDYLSVAGSESPTGSQAKCTGSGVRIRAEAHTAANIYGYANVGDTIKLLADDGWGWSKVQCNGVVGWMSNEYISVKRSGYKTAVCNGTYVNVRNGASTSAGIIRQMQPGDQFQVVCIQPNGWIDTGNGFVYYDKSYISI